MYLKRNKSTTSTEIDLSACNITEGTQRGVWTMDLRSSSLTTRNRTWKHKITKASSDQLLPF